MNQLQSAIPSEVMTINERSMPIDPSEEQLTKLRKDIDVVNVNLKVKADLSQSQRILRERQTAERFRLSHGAV